MKTKKYVIVGNGVAAAGCIEGIRSVDKSGSIVVVSGEKHPVYCRPLISYYLEGRTTVEKMDYRAPDFYETNQCQVLYGARAVNLDTGARRITLDTGESIPYDAVTIATGSSPFVPPMQGLESVEPAGGYKTSFMTLDDALNLEKAIRDCPEARVLIIGAGLIGLKCAEGICDKVISVTVCDLATRVLSSILDDECAALMQARLEEKGIRFLLGDTVDVFQGKTAVMKSRRTVDFDILVLAVGVRANIGLVKEAGGTCGRGIRLDTAGATDLPGIYAAGDCTECTDISSGQTKVIAILPNAYMQGKCAGINMAGGKSVFDQAVPMNSIGFFGLHAMSAGSYDGDLFEKKGPETIKRLFVKDGLLKGFILIGDVSRAGIYTSMIRNRIPLDTVDYEAIKNIPALGGFSAEYRGKKLGGMV